MRLDTVTFQSLQSDERSVQEQPSDQNLLTPARRAALDALERDFQEVRLAPAR